MSTNKSSQRYKQHWGDTCETFQNRNAKFL